MTSVSASSALGALGSPNFDLCTEVEENMENMDLSSVKDAMEKLQAAMELKRQENERRKKECEELEAEKMRILALKDTVKTLTGAIVKEVSQSDKGELQFVVEVLQCTAEIVMDKKKRLSSIKVVSKEFAWVDTNQILEDALQLPAPHDLRCVIQRLAELQP